MDKADEALDRVAPWLFMAVGIGMVVMAAVGVLSDAVAVAFAVLGTGLLLFGGLSRLLEGPFEIGPQRVKGQLAARQRAEAVLEIADATVHDPEVKEAVKDVVDYIAPQPLPHSPGLTAKQQRDIQEAIRGWKPPPIDIEAMRRTLRRINNIPEPTSDEEDRDDES